ncbi:Di-copper centre-containing protein [Athelia psychrophila]|uniref:tyrosinase n=1 Tax=Athelia psychrophila TaxID=1759441 RepID=A0A166F1S8_9AGAM|nr:Di-copper centre-containing protein [Fibularhizoctonia sp. CBS 109695]
MVPYIISGVPIAPGISNIAPNIPSRLEINDFIRNEEHFSLYIQALTALYTTPETDITSFYQIGGIHGMPYVSWDGSPGGERGYCTHRSVLFPTWHRPYVTLLEQAIQAKAATIAQGYQDKMRWNNAATTLRQPFWDWARNAIPPDEIISLKQVTITTPDGKRTKFDNPFLKFKFPSAKSTSTFQPPYRGWGTTLRCPPTEAANAQSDVDELKETLSDAQPELTRDTLALLTLVHTWPTFSNRATSTGSFTNSLEAIHDSIHVYVGGQFGHMQDPAVAAFDPIFYLHHCNVDRLFALWSAVNPGVWVTQQQGPAGVVWNSNTELQPFWNANTTRWRSAGIQATSTFNYTYPEFQNIDASSTSSIKNDILDVVNALYGDVTLGLNASLPASLSGQIPAAFSAAAKAAVSESVHAAPPPAPHPTPPAPVATQVASHQAPVAASSNVAHIFNAASAIIPGVVKSTTPPAHVEAHGKSGSPPFITVPKWTARIRCDHHEVTSSFSVLLFLGDVPDDSKQWRKCASYIGADDVFVNTARDNCENCSRPVSEVEGFVHLNEAIMKHPQLRSLEPEKVKPYLKDHLHWRVKKVSGSVEIIPSLEVVVVETPVSITHGSHHPIVGEPQHMHDVTAGHQGGSRHA